MKSDYRKTKLNIRIIFSKAQNCKSRIYNKHELRLKKNMNKKFLKK